MDPAYNQGMNWITRCPQCATVYQVHPDQPLAAKGWLRCGHCEHVFDSTGLILAWGAASESETMAEGASADVEPKAMERVDIDALLKREDAAGTGQAAADLTSFEHALSAFKPELEKAIADLATSWPVAADGRDVDAVWPESRPEKRHRRWPALLLVIGLLLGLFAQGVWIGRHSLATHFPDLEPLFMQACRLWSCDRPYRRDVHGIVIDTSSFVPLDDGYQLKWIVRNTTHQILEMTALELTLQDSQGKPLFRRVYFPAELAAPPTLTPNQVWPGEIRLKMSNDTPVTGYRVLSFYP